MFSLIVAVSLTIATVLSAHAAPGKMWVGLRSEKVEALAKRVEEISDPCSPDYGKHASFEDVTRLVRPQFASLVAMLPGCKLTGSDDAAICDTETARMLSGRPEVELVMPMESEIRHVPHKPIRTSSQSDRVAPETSMGQYSIPSEDLRYGASVGPVEFQDNRAFYYNDLNNFEVYSDRPRSLNYSSHIIGPFSSASSTGESTLDVEVITGAAQGAVGFYWTVQGWMLDFAIEFMERIKTNLPTPEVASISWGWSEINTCDSSNGYAPAFNCGTNSKTYVGRVNYEFMKLASMGVTLVAASGDAGAHGRTDDYCSTDNMYPIFPGCSPYVLSVGATALTGSPDSNGKSKICKEYGCVKTPAHEQTAMYKNQQWTAGGGFSLFTPPMKHQQLFIKEYLEVSHDHLPPKDTFNPSGRGYPDVAAVGSSIYVILDGRIDLLGGTSASTPLWASIIARMNDARLGRGQAKLGLVSPLLYRAAKECTECFNQFATPESTNRGTERNSCQYGFYGPPTTTKWNPVVGLGSPNVKALLKYDVKLFNGEVCLM